MLCNTKVHVEMLCATQQVPFQKSSASVGLFEETCPLVTNRN